MSRYEGRENRDIGGDDGGRVGKRDKKGRRREKGGEMKEEQ